MGSCTFCNIESNKHKELKSCVCGKVSYCCRKCQENDWKTHRPNCPPFTIRESPGKGRGLFATRRIKEGQIILEEYPLITVSGTLSFDKFPNIDDDIKAKILQLRDPAENLKTLDSETTKEIFSKNSLIMFNYMDFKTDEKSKIFRIFTSYLLQICGFKDLYSDNTEAGFFYNFSFINHACVPNAVTSWVMGDFKKRQIRAMMVIEKGEEILVSYRTTEEFVFGSRESRQKELVEAAVFLGECSVCAAQSEDVEENDRMRAEIREKVTEIRQLWSGERSDPVSRRDMKKVMKLTQQRVKLIKNLNLRAGFMIAMIDFYSLAVSAKMMGISCDNDPDVYKQEALKYAKMWGDRYLHTYNSYLGN